MSLLDEITGPADLKPLSRAQLVELADEIRGRLIAAVSRTGGHLAANLGVVELTIALHYELDSPRDKILWDVGHQCYTHKLLTGRAAGLPTLRQRGGMSGFPRRAESPHDCFDTGHGSTSISAALGAVIARDLRHQDHAVVAVIGDGAMTGGLAFEALNHAGHLGRDLIVVLNDNQMSISRNVGALARYLGRVRAEPHYLRAKENFEAALQRLPRGAAVLEAVEKLKAGVKHLLVPGILFEELGFTYLGPVDGHDLEALIETLRRARGVKGPVLIHAVTTKGKGYDPAERDASRFHRTAPFDIESGEPAAPAGGCHFTSLFGAELVRLAAADPRIVAITAAMPDGAGLAPFAQQFPDRFFDVGMAEGHAVTFAAGLAAAGLRPVVAVYSTFLQRAYDQLLHDVCLQGLPVVLAVDRAGLVGEDGPTHHGLFDLSYLRHLPNMTVMAPRDGDQLAAMLRTALAGDGPAAIRYPRAATAVAAPAQSSAPVVVGTGEMLREGEDLALLAVGSMVAPALEAAELLARQGIAAAVVDARFVKPLDEKLILDLAQRCGGLVTIEENALQGGFGSAVLELLAAHGVAAPVRRVGIPDRFIEHGPRAELLESLGLTSTGIARAATKAARHPERLRPAPR
jgi:1-deoxy-D-xylulose-5-phosphate synthase